MSVKPIEQGKTDVTRAARLSVAPMMDWTDRHCRYLHRVMSRRALLYTEMVTAAAVVHGKRELLLEYDVAEHPVALQLGGSEPELLGQAARIADDFGFDEINLNVGCPSDRVQSGAFGAVLMKDPALVAACVGAMQEAVGANGPEITVKCRIGVDEQTPEDVLPDFLTQLRAAGIRRVAIHARKAWLQGLSPKENRDVPPLDYDLVLRMKREFPDMHVSINGGIADLDQAQGFLDAGLDGVMVGRAAYHAPAQILLDADRRIFGETHAITAEQTVQEMLPYIEAHLAGGGRLHSVTRHMLGLFLGRPGARSWRRVLSEGAHRDGAGVALVEEALAQISQAEARQEELARQG